MENWLRTDEIQEAIISLEVVSIQLPKVSLDDHYWKWAIIGLHNALQGFMVLALQGSNYLNVLTDKCAREWLATYESGRKDYPEPKLDGFLNLYKKIKSERMNIYTSSILFKPNDSQEQSVKKLHSLRNEFIHFVPKGWSLELSGLPQIFENCLDVIHFLAFECGNVFWHEIDEKRTREFISLVRSSINPIKEKYGLT